MHEFETNPEPTFDDREQQEIIALAARLQREAGQSMTLAELEHVAREAGIDPRFVREAARRRTSPRHALSAVASQVSAVHFMIWSAALLLLEGIAMIAALESGPKGMATLFASAVGLLFGLFAARQSRINRSAILLPAAAIFVDLVIFVFAQARALNNSEIDKILFGLCLGQGVIAWAVVGLTNWWSSRGIEKAAERA